MNEFSLWLEKIEGSFLDRVIDRFIEGDGQLQLRYYGDDFVITAWGRNEGRVSAVLDKESGTYELQSAFATGNIGPLLHVVAMEIASEKGNGLMPDRASSSVDDYAVWKGFVQGKTPGVNFHKIPNSWNYAYMHRGPRCVALQYFYKKVPATVIERLRKDGRLKDGSVWF